MRRRILAFPMVLLMALATPCVVVGQQPRVNAPSPLDSLAAQLVELELQRVSSTDAPAPQVAAPRDIGSQIAAIHERLRALPDGAAADREATNRVLLALDARAASVLDRLQKLRLFYMDTHPVVRQSVSEVRAINQRRLEIRRST